MFNTGEYTYLGRKCAVTNAFDRNEMTPPRERPGLITALPAARHVANCLGKIAGVAAVALGGSRARRADVIGSDVDR
jgi:hypothetical protein